MGKDADALKEVNDIRAARGVSNIKMEPGINVLDEVFAERRRELMGEGWRWYDLVRYNRLKRNDSEFNKLLDQGGIYWPIAQDVLTRNPQLVQNAYWR